MIVCEDTLNIIKPKLDDFIINLLIKLGKSIVNKVYVYPDRLLIWCNHYTLLYEIEFYNFGECCTIIAYKHTDYYLFGYAYRLLVLQERIKHNIFDKRNTLNKIVFNYVKEQLETFY